jgi:hypothetical protein
LCLGGNIFCKNTKKHLFVAVKTKSHKIAGN